MADNMFEDFEQEPIFRPSDVYPDLRWDETETIGTRRPAPTEEAPPTRMVGRWEVPAMEGSEEEATYTNKDLEKYPEYRPRPVPRKPSEQDLKGMDEYLNQLTPEQREYFKQKKPWMDMINKQAGNLEERTSARLKGFSDSIKKQYGEHIDDPKVADRVRRDAENIRRDEVTRWQRIINEGERDFDKIYAAITLKKEREANKEEKQLWENREEVRTLRQRAGQIESYLLKGTRDYNTYKNALSRAKSGTPEEAMLRGFVNEYEGNKSVYEEIQKRLKELAETTRHKPGTIEAQKKVPSTTDWNSVMTDARDAIRQGAPKEVVRKRLMEDYGYQEFQFDDPYFKWLK